MPVHRFFNWAKQFFGHKKTVRLGIYGPPNTGKTSLANRIIADFVGGAGWRVSDNPHETREIQHINEVVLTSLKGNTLKIDMFDMPGISTKSELHTDSFEEFLDQGLTEAEAISKLMEATRGIANAIKWMKKVDSALVVLDATQSPFTKVNALLLGVLKANNVKIVVVANKIELPGADPLRIKNALTHLPVVGISCHENRNMDALYDAIARYLH